MLDVQPVAARGVRALRRLRPAAGRLPLPALLDPEGARPLWRHAHRLPLQHLLPGNVKAPTLLSFNICYSDTVEKLRLTK